MLRAPRSSSSSVRLSKPADALEYEIAREMAGALGRLGHALEQALRTLSDFDAARPAGATTTAQAREERRKLTAQAGHALWLFIVQREACGLRDSRQVMRDYSVPPEVRDRMGIFP
jgi:hypothetical protein